MQLFGRKILIIFSEERGEKESHTLLPTEKMTVFASRPKLSNMSHLTGEQRYTIARMLQAGCTKKVICAAIGKDKSVLSRELKRNGISTVRQAR